MLGRDREIAGWAALGMCIEYLITVRRLLLFISIISSNQIDFHEHDFTVNSLYIV